MLALSSTTGLLRTLGRARKIDVQAYTLHGRVLHALEAAARRGADVTVALDGHPFNDARGRLAGENRRLAAELRSAGAHATLCPLLHAKTIAADGALYLDEKNFAIGDIVLRENDPRQAQQIPMVKHAALAAEAAVLSDARAGDRTIVESESFGGCNAVYSSLDALGKAGAAPRLLVSRRELRGNAREHAVIEQLVHDGVRVRVSPDTAKLAAAGDRAWLGSANATWAPPQADSIDWGVATRSASIVRTVRARLEAQWRAAKPFRARELS